MVTEQTTDKNELIAAIGEAITEMAKQMSSLDEYQVNVVPYANSWTPGQLFRHVSKSVHGMQGAMRAPSKPVDRNASEKVAGLKKTFLDFDNKMNSPEFIIPEDGPYDKEAIIDELKHSFQDLTEGSEDANVTDLVEGLPFGPVTKLELLHFTLYHTQRHLQQMHRICDALLNKPAG